MHDHFLAQYNQVWQQRRQHVTLIWAIPTIATAVLTLLFHVLFPHEEGIAPILPSESIWAIIIIGLGLSSLLLRHNFFIKCLGLLLQELDGRRMPFVLPQFGDQFREVYREKLRFWEKIGAIKDGTFWWVVVSYGVILLLVALTVDFVAASFLKDTLELLKDFWWGFPLIFLSMFLWELKQYFFSAEKIKRMRDLAYQFYVQGNYQQGHDLDHWLRAESVVERECKKGLKNLMRKEFWSIFIPLVGLIITLSPRPSIVISANQGYSSRGYVSTELKNVGNASAYDVKFNLFTEKRVAGKMVALKNPQDPLFHKDILTSGQIYQAGRNTVPPEEMASVEELIVRYEITYHYSLSNIPGFDRLKIPVKVQGQFWWEGKKWDVR